MLKQISTQAVVQAIWEHLFFNEYEPFVNEVDKNVNLKLFLESSYIERRVDYYEENLQMLEKIIARGEKF